MKQGVGKKKRARKFGDRKAGVWKFTINNYTRRDLDQVKRLANRHRVVCGIEEGAKTGTPHLQGTVCFGDRSYPGSYLARCLSRAHLSRGSRKDLERSEDYCRKGGRVLHDNSAGSQGSQI